MNKQDSWLRVTKKALLAPCTETAHGPNGSNQQTHSMAFACVAHSSRVHDSFIFMVKGQRYSPYSEGLTLPDHTHPRDVLGWSDAPATRLWQVLEGELLCHNFTMSVQLIIFNRLGPPLLSPLSRKSGPKSLNKVENLRIQGSLGLATSSLWPKWLIESSLNNGNPDSSCDGLVSCDKFIPPSLWLDFIECWCCHPPWLRYWTRALERELATNAVE